jgi:transcriptional regulator with XRE-family HTH domain
MPARERAVDRGTRQAAQQIAELGREIREARLGHGLSQVHVGRSVGLSGSEVSRIERGLISHVSLLDLSRLLSVIGLELSARAFPSGGPVRDVAHARLLARLQALLPAEALWRTEVPLPLPGDQRAWDALIRLGPTRIGVEAETRLRDLQAVLRRIELKRRDGGVGSLILLLSDTRTNRQLVREYSDALTAGFPTTSADALASLRVGRPPAGDALVLL